MKNIITAAIIIILPIMAFADTMSEINKLMDKIKNNTESYRLICYRHMQNRTWSFELELNNKKEYCIFLKEEIESDIDMVLKLRGKK